LKSGAAVLCSAGEDEDSECPVGGFVVPQAAAVRQVRVREAKSTPRR
jgi:hypothetical protein